MSEADAQDIVELFESAEDFIALAGANGSMAVDLIFKQSEQIAGLFISSQQVIDLAKRQQGGGMASNDNAVHALIGSKQSEKIVALFISDEEIVALTNECVYVQGYFSEKVAPKHRF